LVVLGAEEEASDELEGRVVRVEVNCAGSFAREKLFLSVIGTNKGIDAL
jgi:hypothetical protein